MEEIKCKCEAGSWVFEKKTSKCLKFAFNCIFSFIVSFLTAHIKLFVLF